MGFDAILIFFSLACFASLREMQQKGKVMSCVCVCTLIKFQVLMRLIYFAFQFFLPSSFVAIPLVHIFPHVLIRTKLYALVNWNFSIAPLYPEKVSYFISYLAIKIHLHSCTVNHLQWLAQQVCTKKKGHAKYAYNAKYCIWVKIRMESSIVIVL